MSTSKTLAEQIKNQESIKLQWIKNEDNEDNKDNLKVLAKGEPMSTFLGLSAFLLLIEKENDLYLGFSADQNRKFLVPINDLDAFNKMYKGYFTKFDFGDINFMEMMAVSRKMQSDPEITKPYKWDTTDTYYAGLASCISELENGAVFNNFLSKIPLRQATAFWNKVTDPMVSGYRTIYSDSQIVFYLHTGITIKVGDEENVYHPLIVRVNYPEMDINESQMDEINKELSYDYPYGMPLDLIGALENFGFDLHDEEDMEEFKLQDEELAEIILNLF